MGLRLQHHRNPSRNVIAPALDGLASTTSVCRCRDVTFLGQCCDEFVDIALVEPEPD